MDSQENGREESEMLAVYEEAVVMIGDDNDSEQVIQPEVEGVGPKILNDSRCVKQLDVLSCVCISEGLPLPTIKWPLLETHTEYSVTTTVSNHTVNSSIRLSLMAENKTTFECVSSNDNGQTKHNLSVKNYPHNTVYSDVLQHHGPSVVLPWTIAAVSLCVNICLISTLYLCEGLPLPTIKWPLLENHTEYSVTTTVSNHTVNSSIRLSLMAQSKTTFECVSSNDNGQTKHNLSVDADQAIVDDITRDQQAAEGAEAAWPLAPGEDNVNPKEAEYADIDVSKLKRKSPTEDKGTQKTSDSEYAEIKKEKTMDRQNNGREESEMLVVYEEAAVVMGDKESEQVIQAEVEGGEDMALYSNVNEIMGRIYLNGVSEE
ncbi:hypothetical protein Q8A73_007628 [Channa argus]|nr:hypothetical protein Q8A73_007628 [Channa argus]